MGAGFLGYPSTFMLDVVVCALLLVVPTLLYSLYVVKVRKNYLLHRNLQITLGILLLVAVVLFEIDMRLHGGWKNIVLQDPSRLTQKEFALVTQILYVHLVFAISTPILWATTLSLAWRRFSRPPVPGRHSQLHKVLGWLSTIDITCTSVTGLVFYYFAFMV